MAAPLVRSGQLAFAEEFGSEASAGLKLFQVDDKMLKYLLDGGKCVAARLRAQHALHEVATPSLRCVMHHLAKPHSPPRAGCT